MPVSLLVESPRHLRVVFRRTVRRIQKLGGLRYGVRILIGGAIAWLLLQWVGRTDPLWAMISVVVVTDRRLDAALTAFRSRLTNTIIGCIVGLTFLFLFGGSVFTILLAMATSVVVSSDLIKVPVSWRIAPITVVIVMIPAVLGHAPRVAEHMALMRTGEVLLGSAIAVAVTFATSWIFHRLELRREAGEPEEADIHDPSDDDSINIDE